MKVIKHYKAFIRHYYAFIRLTKSRYSILTQDSELWLGGIKHYEYSTYIISITYNIV